MGPAALVTAYSRRVPVPTLPLGNTPQLLLGAKAAGWLERVWLLGPGESVSPDCPTSVQRLHEAGAGTGSGPVRLFNVTPQPQPVSGKTGRRSRKSSSAKCQAGFLRAPGHLALRSEHTMLTGFKVETHVSLED